MDIGGHRLGGSTASMCGIINLRERLVKRNVGMYECPGSTEYSKDEFWYII